MPPWFDRFPAHRSHPMAYIPAVLIPLGLTYGVAWLHLPAFVFEHLVILLVLVVAIPGGLGPGIVTAVVSVVADNVLLRPPFGSPTIGGYRDVFDLALFALVAVVVSQLMRRAHQARAVAEEAAERERRIREERDQLVATITHDLATPLNVLSGTVQFARHRGTLDGAELDRLLGRLETASARAASLVRSLADAPQLDSSPLPVQLEVHDLRALVTPIVDMMDRFSERHPVVLAAPPHAVPVHADGDRFQRALENLVHNAIKYSPDGGAVEVSIATDAERAIVQVRDYGIGIAAAALPHIFDRSFRAPDAAKYAPGLGLGLSIARQVITAHQGNITAAAAPGRGTVVTVDLPLAAAVSCVAPERRSIDRLSR